MLYGGSFHRVAGQNDVMENIDHEQRVSGVCVCAAHVSHQPHIPEASNSN